MFKLNSIMRVLRATEGSETSASAGVPATDFNPSIVTQGEGVFEDMRNQAELQQKSEEETGSVTLEAASDTVVDDKSKDEQVATVVDKVDETAAKEASDTTTEATDTGYSYKGLAVDVTNTPEMIESFKENGLDIDAVNKELYSEKGITTETRGKLDEAFGKMSVDMYLEGLESKNAAMLETHNTNSANQEAAMDAVIKESTGDNLDAVMKWANDNLDAKIYSAYADIINGDNTFQVGLALKDLTAQSGLQSNKSDQPEVKAKVVDRLISADVTDTKGTANAISSKEYQAAIHSREYYKDTNGWDARREAGMLAGI